MSADSDTALALEDAARYRKLKPMLACAHFAPEDLGLDAGHVALIFVLPGNTRVSANLDATLDAMGGQSMSARVGVPITKDTRWPDAKGRIWRVIDDLHFGRYLCVVADSPAYSGEWTAAEIRLALACHEGAQS